MGHGHLRDIRPLTPNRQSSKDRNVPQGNGYGAEKEDK